MESGKAARLLAKVLQQCQTVLESEEAVKALWSQSRLHWNTLGISDDHLGDFLLEMVGCCIKSYRLQYLIFLAFLFARILVIFVWR